MSILRGQVFIASCLGFRAIIGSHARVRRMADQKISKCAKDKRANSGQSVACVDHDIVPALLVRHNIGRVVRNTVDRILGGRYNYLCPFYFLESGERP